MSKQEFSFNIRLSEAIRTRADYTYKISSTMISIACSGLGLRPVNEDLKAVF
jgi:hypothetical protein